jgi:hypothetical protein
MVEKYYFKSKDGILWLNKNKQYDNMFINKKTYFKLVWNIVGIILKIFIVRCLYEQNNRIH